MPATIVLMPFRPRSHAPASPPASPPANRPGPWPPALARLGGLAALAATLAASPTAWAAKANLLVNGDFAAGPVGWTGFDLADGRPLLNLFVSDSGELTLQGRYHRCGPGEPSSCYQLPMSPLLSQQVTLTAGTYKLSWSQHNDAQMSAPLNAFDVRVLAPGEPLYVRDPANGNYYRTAPDMQGPLWVLDPETHRWVNAPPTTHTLKFKAPVDGVYTLYLALHGVGRSVDTGLPYDTAWIDNLLLTQVCKKVTGC